jgi:hypothetical protein
VGFKEEIIPEGTNTNKDTSNDINDGKEQVEKLSKQVKVKDFSYEDNYRIKLNTHNSILS